MREQYLQMRRNGQLDLGWLYKYYTGEFDKDKHKPFIKPHEFAQLFMIYANTEIQAIVRYLDEKFGVQKIEGENGQIIYIN